MSIEDRNRIEELERKVANMRADIEAMVRDELRRELTRLQKLPEGLKKLEKLRG